MPDSAYVAALKMLGRRELSERQVRQRLARRGYDQETIDAAVVRLTNDGSLDDERAARAMAHAVDADALIGAALQKRLRGREQIAGDREFQRLYRYLIGQGFESDRVVALLRRRKGRED